MALIDCVNVHTSNMSAFCYDGHVLTEKQNTLMYSYLLYTSHANSILTVGSPVFNELVYVDHDGEVSLFVDQTVKQDSSMQHLFMLDAITETCQNNCQLTHQDETDSTQQYNASELIDFFSAYLEARKGMTLDVRSFTQDHVFKMIKDTSTNANPAIALSL
ncbi:hypothetical protein AB4455_23045 [Vibrio sp. 10N.261.46.E12]|uniref:hypothetical protein n=1 Tax=unclassified Vibrio TaxID=2614977 RepID=UPI000975DBA0|nr:MULTISPECIES: hypothetical protein [unclassified Vibrio]OMO38447.1 hypothetical protein BH584_17760 [Vibrio sp. 10N.261.45.E1]PMJ36233.1 hypothetical protein BCU27_23620 [Vibrio sp. 10N.286.45.B6]PML84189.1 hypothetical protein BCT66_17955 [Vibrio sp. 10N.261.49.E11]PMM89305.1 hypothetical protein BCT46_25240 [Vibrio sp. 10N.261.46.E8]PMN44191.1 hypothetical protein BCT32_15755 [Vibrio sp. 10N.261.45.E11]